MKKVGKPMFFVVVAVIVLLTAMSFFGLSYSYGDNKTTFIKGAGDIRWGIDIRGGVDVTFSPPDDYDATDDEMAAAESIIKVRLVSQNITDSEVYTDYNKDRIIVRFPWKEGESDFNPETAVKELGETALLTFRENTSGPVILEGKDVEKAEAGINPENNEYIVSLKLTSEGAKLFADATGRLVGQKISIWMDDTMISAPNVNQQIPSGEAIISGGSGQYAFTAEEAKSLADKINGGALPFKLETENFSSISPTLGMGARDAMVMAGGGGFGGCIRSGFALYHCALPPAGCGSLHRACWTSCRLGSLHFRFLRECPVVHPDTAGYRGHHPFDRYGRGCECHHVGAHQGGAEKRKNPGRRDRFGLPAHLCSNF